MSTEQKEPIAHGQDKRHTKPVILNTDPQQTKSAPKFQGNFPPSLAKRLARHGVGGNMNPEERKSMNVSVRKTSMPPPLAPILTNRRNTLTGQSNSETIIESESDASAPVSQKNKVVVIDESALIPHNHQKEVTRPKRSSKQKKEKSSSPIPPEKIDKSNTSTLSSSQRSFPKCPESRESVKLKEPTSKCLQEAICNCKQDATIIVPEGEYKVSLNISKSIQFVAEGKVIFRPQNTNSVITSNSSYLSFDGFSIKRDDESPNALIQIEGGATYFRNCKFSTSKSKVAIQIYNDSNVQISNSKIKGIECVLLFADQTATIQCKKTIFIGQGEIGVFLNNQSAGFFNECSFKESSKAAIISFEQSKINAHACTFSATPIAIFNSEDSNEVMSCNFKSSNQPSLICGSSATVNISSSKITNGLLDCRDCSNVHSSDNRFLNSSLYVWGSTKVESCNDSFTGEASAAISVFDYSSLTLKHGTISDIIGCGLLCYGSSETKLEFTQFKSIRDSSVFCHSGANILICDCEFTKAGNTAIFISTSPRSQILRCTIRENALAGIELSDTNNFIIKETVISSNKKCGMILTNCSGTITNCQFASNYFSGLHSTNSSCNIDQCKFIHNKKGGLFCFNNSHSKVNSSIFESNEWAAISVDKTTIADIVSTTFSNNSLAINDDGKVTLTKCKISDHSSTAVQVKNTFICTESRFERCHAAIVLTNDSKMDETKSIFNENEVHFSSVGKNEFQCIGTEFNNAKSNAGVILGKNCIGTFSHCIFNGNSTAALIVLGKANIFESEIKNSGAAGIVFEEGSECELFSSKIENNGMYGLHIYGGDLNIQKNVITGHKMYGIYISNVRVPQIENNTFRKNQITDVWRQ
ncbi:serine/threonine protein kinase [Histomonas meleagridis]|uniref:serine/threonine protein kinase n=1 Tax=Histomonas meleagridis TaxID=135588 RepID=UPI00355AA4A3|nr:serine/threonine protein kinase [Histomonas meleagridis]KAH0805389.1 serine/threonine protein kinase [Histomonas meleagridis]